MAVSKKQREMRKLREDKKRTERINETRASAIRNGTQRLVDQGVHEDRARRQITEAVDKLVPAVSDG